jgi:hypothetical protein
MVDMSQPTMLIMNSDQSFTTDEDDTLGLSEWAAVNGVSDRTVKRWLSENEIPGAEQRGPKKTWRIPATAMRISEEERARRAAEGEEPGAEVAIAAPTGGTVANVEPELEIDEEFQDHLWRGDLATYLSRMPAYIPVRIGAAMLGLGIGTVKGNPERFGILHRGGPNQTDVMPKRIILSEAGLL